MAHEVEAHHKEAHKHAAPHGAHDGGHDDEGHEGGAPEWIVSFADNTALMMGFFVILLAMNMGPKGSGSGDGKGEGNGTGQPTAQELDWVLGVREGFHNPVSLDSTKPGEAMLVARLRERQGKGTSTDSGVSGDADKVQSIRTTSDFYNFSAAVSFAANSTQLFDTSLDTIASFAKQIQGLELMVEVRGHVSAAEAHQMADRGVRVSIDRAMAVAQTLQKEGVEWKRMRIIGCSDGDRYRATAYDEADQQLNRRVEMILTSDLIADKQSLPYDDEAEAKPQSSQPAQAPAQPARPATKKAPHSAPAAPAHGASH